MSSPVGPVNQQYPAPFTSGPQPCNVAEFERYAQEYLPKNAFDYYASGSNDMITLRENRDAFARLRIMPRALIDVNVVNVETTILGDKVSSPICIAPTAMQKMSNPDGEVATSKAAAKSNTLMTLSSWSTTSLEEVAEVDSKAIRWFQLYVYKDRVVTMDLVRRAERAGYKAFAVTVDTPVLGRREADIKNRFALPNHLTMANFTSQGGSLAEGTKNKGGSGSGLASYVASLIDKSLNWDDIKWLRKNSKLKIVVKGIMTVEDALKAIDHGVDGIWVSNHGARQLDTAPATIEVLPEICRAVGNKCEVYLDGGVTRGTDVVKALALGARAVFIGRPVLWGLAHSGSDGVSNVLQLLNDELVMAMRLSGAVSLKDLKPSMIRTALSFQSRL